MTRLEVVWILLELPGEAVARPARGFTASRTVCPLDAIRSNGWAGSNSYSGFGG
jgi:hypothetical protein